ncbi:MAG: response regulator [Bacteroidetes bacterium]|nr:response regulator [Bacteroidota bacterium]MCH8523056.1 response regulator [Balneolales bacterium]
MNTNLFIMCIEDESEVLEAILRDLEMFEDYFRIEAAQSVDEAKEVLKVLINDGLKPALFICDHKMPGTTGVDYLVELSREEATSKAARMLLTGQAGQQDTIKAVNQAGLHYYLPKPWKPAELQRIVTELLTDFVSKNEDNLMAYMAVLDAEKLSEAMRNRNTYTDM